MTRPPRAVPAFVAMPDRTQSLDTQCPRCAATHTARTAIHAHPDRVRRILHDMAQGWLGSHPCRRSEIERRP